MATVADADDDDDTATYDYDYEHEYDYGSDTDAEESDDDFCDKLIQLAKERAAKVRLESQMREARMDQQVERLKMTQLKQRLGISLDKEEAEVATAATAAAVAAALASSSQAAAVDKAVKGNQSNGDQLEGLEMVEVSSSAARDAESNVPVKDSDVDGTSADGGGGGENTAVNGNGQSNGVAPTQGASKTLTNGGFAATVASAVAAAAKANGNTGDDTDEGLSDVTDDDGNKVPPSAVAAITIRRLSEPQVPNLSGKDVEAMPLSPKSSFAQPPPTSNESTPLTSVGENAELKESDEAGDMSTRRNRPLSRSRRHSQLVLNVGTGVPPHTLASLYVQEALASREYWLQDLMKGHEPKLDRLTTKQLAVYGLYHWWPVRSLYNAIVVFHCMLIMWEAPNPFLIDTYTEDGSALRPKGISYFKSGCPELHSTPSWVLGIDGLICFIFMLDVSVIISSIGRRFWRNPWNFAQVSLTFLVVLDSVLAIILGHAFNHARVLRTLRPLLLIPNNKGLRRQTTSLGRTAAKLGNFTFLTIGFLCLNAVLAVQIQSSLAEVFCAPETLQNAKSVQNKLESIACRQISGERWFYNFPYAMLSLFVLMTTENYPDVAMPLITLQNATTFFFVYFVAIGVWVIMSVLLAVMFSAFKDAKVKQVCDARKLERLYLIRAFMLICDDRERLSAPSFDKMLLQVEPNWQPKRRQMAYDFLDEDGSRSIDVFEFFRFLDVLKLEVKRKRSHLEMRGGCIRHTPLGAKLLDICDDPRFDIGISVVIIINLIQMVVQTTLVWEQDTTYKQAMQFLDYALVGIFILEMVTKLLAFGRQYFRHASNNVDCFLVITSLLPFAFEVMADTNISINPSLLRIIRILRLPRLIRILKVKPELKALIATFLRIFKPLSSMAVYVLIVMYVFSVVAMTVFGCSYQPEKELLEDVNAATVEDIDAGNFDDKTRKLGFFNIGTAMLTNFQLMTTSNWHDVMYSVMDSTGSGYSALYFILFEVSVTYFMLNIVIALIIEAFQMEQLFVLEKNNEAPDPDLLAQFNSKARFKVTKLGDQVAEDAMSHGEGEIFNVRLKRRFSRDLVKKESEILEYGELEQLGVATGMDLISLKSEHEGWSIDVPCAAGHSHGCTSVGTGSTAGGLSASSLASTTTHSAPHGTIMAPLSPSGRRSSQQSMRSGSMSAGTPGAGGGEVKQSFLTFASLKQGVTVIAKDERSEAARRRKSSVSRFQKVARKINTVAALRRPSLKPLDESHFRDARRDSTDDKLMPVMTSGVADANSGALRRPALFTPRARGVSLYNAIRAVQANPEAAAGVGAGTCAKPDPDNGASAAAGGTGNGDANDDGGSWTRTVTRDQGANSDATTDGRTSGDANGNGASPTADGNGNGNGNGLSHNSHGVSSLQRLVSYPEEGVNSTSISTATATATASATGSPGKSTANGTAGDDSHTDVPESQAALC